MTAKALENKNTSKMLEEEFAKEERFLKGVQSALQTKRSKITIQVNRLTVDIKNLENSGNYQSASYLRNSLDTEKEKLIYLDALAKSPYYARIDFRSEQGDLVSYHVGSDKIQSTKGFHVYEESSWPQSVLSGDSKQLFLSGENLTPVRIFKVTISDGKLVSVEVTQDFEQASKDAKKAPAANAMDSQTLSAETSAGKASAAKATISTASSSQMSPDYKDDVSDQDDDLMNNHIYTSRFEFPAKAETAATDRSLENSDSIGVETVADESMDTALEKNSAASQKDVPADVLEGKDPEDTNIVRLKNPALESLKSLLDKIQDLETVDDSASLTENMDDRYEQFSKDLADFGLGEDSELDNLTYSSPEEIKNLPLERSFIVQGFSGCGKKEILKYRTQRIHDDPEVHEMPVILTPTSFLASELEAFLNNSNTKVYSFSEYYASIFEEITGEKALKINCVRNVLTKPEVFRSETENYIHEIIINKVNGKNDKNQWNSLHDLERDLNIPVSDSNDSECAGLRRKSFSSALEQCRRALGELERVSAMSKRDLTDLKTTKQHLDASIKETKQNYEQIRRNTIDSLNSLISGLDSELNEIPKLLRNEEIAQEYITNESEKLSREVVAASALRSYRSSNRQKYIEDTSVSMKMSEEEAEFVHKTVGDLEIKVRKLEKQLNSTSSFNFIKRNRMQSDLKTAKEQLLKARETAADYLENSVYQKIKQIKEKESELSNQMGMMSNAIFLTKKKTAVENAVVQLRNTAGWNRKISLSPEDLELIQAQVREYERICSLLENLEKNLYECVQGIKDLEKTIQRTEKVSNITGLKNHYAKLKEIEEKTSFKEIRKLFEKTLLPAYFEIEEDLAAVLPERAVRYLELLIAEAYYQTQLKSRPISVLQAQELSVREMKLLTNITGNSVWNLYGDINQCTDDATGLTDWEQIQAVKQMPLYCINECTGKSKEISEFCNKTFHAGMVPAGSSKYEVQLSESLSTGAKSLLVMKHRYNAKCSIILSADQSFEENTLLAAFDKNSLSMHKIDESKISVLYPEEALGLSFDAALVITDKMNQTQKYISYTRPNDCLILYGEEQ